jgi:hypothetical protein
VRGLSTQPAVPLVDGQPRLGTGRQPRQRHRRLDPPPRPARPPRPRPRRTRHPALPTVAPTGPTDPPRPPPLADYQRNLALARRVRPMLAPPQRPARTDLTTTTSPNHPERNSPGQETRRPAATRARPTPTPRGQRGQSELPMKARNALKNRGQVPPLRPSVILYSRLTIGMSEEHM